MALDFPSPPYDGEIYVDPTSGSKYVYVAASTKWMSIQHTGVITAYGFDKANSAFLHANAAFDSANNVGPQIAPTYNTANAAFIHANSAFNVANNALPNTSNAVFNGNLRVTGTLLIGTNTVTITDESIIAQSIIVGGSPIPSGVTSNLAFDTANAAFNSANNVGPQIAPTYNTANAAYTTANDAYTSSNSANSYADATYVKLTAPNQTITGDLAITGNLSLLGNVTTLRSNNLVVNDSLIYLAANNDQSDIIDIGFVGNYSNGTANLHTGLFRDHNTKQYFLFNDLAGPEPETINDIIPYANGMINAVLNADIATSNLILGGANAINWITSLYNSSNSDYVVSNAAFATVNAAFGVANTALQNTNVTLAGSLTITSSLGIGTGASGTTGEIRATNNITAYYSDERLKNVISTIQSPLEKIKQLSGVIYTNNDVAASFGYTDMSEQVGLLAGQVEKVLPQIVKPAPFDTEFIDGVEVSKSGQNYKTVQYEKLIPLLVEAIKEQQKQIDELRKK